jgi:hypothetical protein
MKNCFRWLSEIFHWARQVPITNHYWWAIAVVGVSFFVVGASGWTEKGFRLAGMTLQLAGVLTVVWGILRTRADFGQPTVRSQFKIWTKVFPPLHSPTKTATVNVVLPGLMGEAYGYSTHGPAVDQTIEGRMTHLESVVKKLEMAQGRTHIAVLQAERKAQQSIDTQARHQAGQIDAVARKVEATATSGVHVSAVGVVFLFFGTILGSAALELHQLLVP